MSSLERNTQPGKNPHTHAAVETIREKIALQEMTVRFAGVQATAIEKAQFRNRLNPKRASFSVEFLGELVTACPELRALTLGELFSLEPTRTAK